MLSIAGLIVLLACVNISIQDDKEETIKLPYGVKKSNLVKRSLMFPSDPPPKDICNSMPETANTVCKEAGSCSGVSRNSKICGWNGAEPMVCCTEKKKKTKKTSSRLYSNLECGIEQGIYRPEIRRIKKREARPEPLEVEHQVYSVVGGYEVIPLSYPWMGALDKVTFGTNHRLLCGSSLISPRHVLTAAHCFQEGDDKTPEKFSVRLEAHRLMSGTRYSIQTITIHPGYNFRENYNDIAVLTLKEEVPTSGPIVPICLPEAEDGQRQNLTGRDAIVLGWGNTYQGGPNSQVLLEVTIPIVDTSGCNLAYMRVDSRTFPRGITDDFICAGVEEGGKDSCQNDSGGPLQMREGNRFVQVGIVSFGYGCAEPGFPGIYTRVGPYVPWINKVMEDTL